MKVAFALFQLQWLLLPLSKAQPPNNSCETASNLTFGAVMLGSNNEATVDTLPSSCEDSTTASFAVWYSVVGNGNVITADTCDEETDFDTQLSVVEGSCDGNFLCVAEGDDECSLSSKVNWKSRAGVQYYVIVHSYVGLGSNTSGTFGLTLLSQETPMNDDCANAQPISVGAAIEGSTAFSADDSAPRCNIEYAAPGVWFKTNGTGKVMTADTCLQAEQNTAISVFSGSCASLSCEWGNDLGSSCVPIGAVGASSVSWASVLGEEYFVLVHGELGDFTLSLSSDEPAINDVCESAQALIMGESQQSSSLGATADNLDSCGVSALGQPGTFFTVVGDGNTVMLDLCSNLVDLDLAISVYQGVSCSGLSCVGGGSWESSVCPTAASSSSYSWVSEMDVVYYVHIHGSVGDYQVYVDSLPTTENNACENAKALAIGDIIGGSTLGATFDDVDYCGISNQAQGVWYTLVGDGKTIQADTCMSADFNSRISVLSGNNCDSLVCLDGSASPSTCSMSLNSSSLVWASQVGELYHVLVHGGAGNFSLATSSSVRPEGDICEDAPSIAIGTTVSGSTIGATTDNAGYCGVFNFLPGVWMNIIGNSETITVDTCELAEFDSRISVYTGECESLDCVTGEFFSNACSSSSSFSSSVSWPSVNGTVYRLLLHGGVGNYTVRTSSRPTPTNDQCTESQNISIGESTNGTTIGATADDTDFCGASISAPGTWYSFVADGNTATVGTCSFVEGFDSKVSVFQGSCGELACIDGSSFGCGSSLSLGSSISFPTEEGSVYHVLVHGGIGNFTLSVSSDVPPDNEVCDSALALTDEVVIASTALATPSEVPSCSLDQISAPGLWFVVEGVNGTMTIDTCGLATNFDTKLALFEGGCGALVCIDEIDDSCGLSSSISWQSTPGSTFYVFVYGHAGGTGTVEIALDPPPTNALEIDGATAP